jgi:menaquinone-dependent protoporphyrinogen oxidase
MSYPRLAVFHSSRFGQSEKVGRFLASGFAESGIETDLFDVRDPERPGGPNNATGLEEGHYQGAMLVASVHYGHVGPKAIEWALRHNRYLATLPTCLIVVSLAAGGEGHRDPELNRPTQALIAKTGWHPDQMALVAGCVDYPRYGFIDRHLIRQIMKARNGPTDLSASHESTDWAQVGQIGQRFAHLILSPKEAVG